MSDEFNIEAAVDQIGADLGFASDSKDPVVDAPKDAPTAEIPAQPAQESTLQTDVDPKQPGDKQSPETVEEVKTDATDPTAIAPKTWRKEAAAEYAALSPTLRAEIHKREEDMFKGIEGYKQQAQIGTNFAQMLEPFQQYFQSTGINPYDEIQGLLGFAHTAKFGTPEQKMDMILAVMQDCGLDPLDAAEFAQTRPQVDPQVRALQNELNQVKSAQRNEELARQNQVRSTLDAQISAFAADPKNVYFDEVVNEMAAFYNAGISKTLEDAYERAVRANPVTHAKEQARLAAEANAQNQAKIAQAKQAQAANLRTSTRQASATAPTGTMDETLESTLREIRNRG